MYNIENEIKKAKEDVIGLITKDNDEQKALMELSERYIKISFTDSNTIGDTCFAASSTPIIDIINDKVVFKRCEITYQELKDSTDINHYRVDLRHELFHAFTQMLSLGNNLKKINDKQYLGFGGKIVDFTDIKNQKNLPATVLFNEIVTDISAYSSYYGKDGINLENIVNGNGLEQIEDNYGHGNGYFNLLPLGKCFIKSFSNYNCDYNQLQQQTYCATYKSDNNDNIFYNDLFYSVMYDPFHTMNQFKNNTSENEWEILNNVSGKILTLHEKNMKPDYYDVKMILDMLAGYLNNKYAKIDDPVLQQNFAHVIYSFNNSYNDALKFYSNSNSKSM